MSEEEINVKSLNEITVEDNTFNIEGNLQDCELLMEKKQKDSRCITFPLSARKLRCHSSSSQEENKKNRIKHGRDDNKNCNSNSSTIQNDSSIKDKSVLLSNKNVKKTNFNDDTKCVEKNVSTKNKSKLSILERSKSEIKGINRKEVDKYTGTSPKSPFMPYLDGCSMTDAEKVRLNEIMQDEPMEDYINWEKEEVMYNHNLNAQKRLEEINEQLKTFTISFKSPSKLSQDEPYENENQEDCNQIEERKSKNDEFLMSSKNPSPNQLEICLNKKLPEQDLTQDEEKKHFEMGMTKENNTEPVIVISTKPLVTESEMDEVERRYNERLREINETILSLKQEASQEAEMYMSISNSSIPKEN